MTKYDRNFCKPDENGKPLYCPLPLAVVIHHHGEGTDPDTGEHWESDWDERRTEVFPTDADKALMGYLPLSPDYPVDPPQGKHYERTGKIESNGADGYRWTYTLVDDPPPPPRTFSKLKLYAVLSAANLWDALKAWLEAQTYEGMNAWTAFSLAQEMTEDHPMFTAWFSAAKTALGVDDATAEELLSKCVKEGY